MGKPFVYGAPGTGVVVFQHVQSKDGYHQTLTSLLFYSNLIINNIVIMKIYIPYFTEISLITFKFDLNLRCFETGVISGT